MKLNVGNAMDNNDKLKEIAERTMVEMESNHSDLKGSLFRNVIKQDYLLPALTEAYNLGIPVSVKEYAVEVLTELKGQVSGLLSQAEKKIRTNPYSDFYSGREEALDEISDAIESTITQIKSNPSGNIGIDKWIPVTPDTRIESKRQVWVWHNKKSKFPIKGWQDEEGQWWVEPGFLTEMPTHYHEYQPYPPLP